MSEQQFPTLSKYTPAETLIIFSGENVGFDDLITVTVMDLFLKNVLKIETTVRQFSASDEPRSYKYVTIGPYYASYIPLHHETVFLDFFKQEDHQEIFLRNFIKVANDHILSSGLYRDSIIKNPMMHEYFHQSLLQIPFGKFSLNEKGKELAKLIHSEFEKAERIIDNNGKFDDEITDKIASEIGGNIFLIKGLNFSHMKELNTDLLNELQFGQGRISDFITQYHWPTEGIF